MYREHHLKNIKAISKKWNIFYPASGSRSVTVDEMANQIPEIIAFMSNFGAHEIRVKTDNGEIAIYKGKS